MKRETTSATGSAREVVGRAAATLTSTSDPSGPGGGAPRPSAPRAAPTARQLAGMWLVGLGLVAALTSARLLLRPAPEALETVEVPVQLRGALATDDEALARRYLYTSPFELGPGRAVKLMARRSPADGILAVEVDLVPEQGPAELGAALFLRELMSTSGLTGRDHAADMIRGAPPGRYRLRVAGYWVPQPGERRTPSATLSASLSPTPDAFAWLALLMLAPALLTSLRWARARGRAPRQPGPAPRRPPV